MSVRLFSRFLFECAHLFSRKMSVLFLIFKGNDGCTSLFEYLRRFSRPLNVSWNALVSWIYRLNVSVSSTIHSTNHSTEETDTFNDTCNGLWLYVSVSGVYGWVYPSLEQYIQRKRRIHSMIHSTVYGCMYSSLQCIVECVSIFNETFHEPFNGRDGYIQRHMQWFVVVCPRLWSVSLHVQPIAFGVSFHLNLQSQSHWSLFNGTWQMRTREIDHRLRFEIEEIKLHEYIQRHIQRFMVVCIRLLHMLNVSPFLKYVHCMIQNDMTYVCVEFVAHSNMWNTSSLFKSSKCFDVCPLYDTEWYDSCMCGVRGSFKYVKYVISFQICEMYVWSSWLIQICGIRHLSWCVSTV